MGTRGLPDMYTLGPRASGVHIRQTTRAHVTTIKWAMLWIPPDMCGLCNSVKACTLRVEPPLMKVWLRACSQ